MRIGGRGSGVLINNLGPEDWVEGQGMGWGGRRGGEHRGLQWPGVEHDTVNDGSLSPEIKGKK